MHHTEIAQKFRRPKVHSYLNQTNKEANTRMTDMDQKEKSRPLDHAQDNVVKCPAADEKQIDEPPNKRQCGVSHDTASVSSSQSQHQHTLAAYKQEQEQEQEQEQHQYESPTASVAEHDVKSLNNNVASDHVLKQEEEASDHSLKQEASDHVMKHEVMTEVSGNGVKREEVGDYLVKQEASDPSMTPQESSCTAAVVVKKEQEQQQQNEVADYENDEVILEWYDYRNYHCDKEAPVLSLSVDKMLKEGKTLTDTDAVDLIDPGESQERWYTMKLVQKNQGVKQEENTSVKKTEEELANISFYWWKDDEEANLMNFSQHSQYMANFCYDLWRAAHRNRNHFDGMSIEFGESRYSYVPLNELIEEAIDDGGLTPHVTFIGSTNSDTNQHGKRIMDSFVRFVGQDSNLIAHETDFMNLKLYIQFVEQTREFISDYESFEFIELLAQKKKLGWFVRAGEPDLD